MQVLQPDALLGRDQLSDVERRLARPAGIGSVGRVDHHQHAACARRIRSGGVHVHSSTSGRSGTSVRDRLWHADGSPVARRRRCSATSPRSRPAGREDPRTAPATMTFTVTSVRGQRTAVVHLHVDPVLVAALGALVLQPGSLEVEVVHLDRSQLPGRRRVGLDVRALPPETRCVERRWSGSGPPRRRTRGTPLGARPVSMTWSRTNRSTGGCGGQVGADLPEAAAVGGGAEQAARRCGRRRS